MPYFSCPAKARERLFCCHIMGKTLLFLLLLQLGLTYVLSLSCESCLLSTCPLVTGCKAGLVMDVCNCCATCAQAEGERCGGRFDLDGKCGIELYCQQLQRPMDYALKGSGVGTCLSKSHLEPEAAPSGAMVPLKKMFEEILSFFSNLYF